MDQRTSLADHFQIIEEVTGIVHQRRDCFARVQNASAAKTDDRVAAAGHLSALAHSLDRRFAVGLKLRERTT